MPSDIHHGNKSKNREKRRSQIDFGEPVGLMVQVTRLAVFLPITEELLGVSERGRRC
jgi:hypothetical protein